MQNQKDIYRLPKLQRTTASNDILFKFFFDIFITFDTLHQIGAGMHVKGLFVSTQYIGIYGQITSTKGWLKRWWVKDIR